MLFFFICYVSMELLNGHDVIFTRIFGFSASWSERIWLIKNVFYDFFRFPKFIFNYLMFIFLYLITKGITNKTKLSCTIVSSIAVIFGVINYIVTEVRGISITISDIYSIQTAVNVAKGIRFHIEGNFIVGVLLFIISNVILWKVYKTESKDKKIVNRIITTLVGICGIIAIFTSNTLMNRIAIWDINESYAESGAGLTLMRMIKDLKIEKPQNYNANKVIELLSQYEDDTQGFEGNLPNVVVVMNESFADLQSLFNFDILEDNLSYYHQLIEEENTISGVMHSSKYGGGTANVEYEFLTQNTTAFLPTGSVPYQQYISKPVNQSIVTYMNKLNYNSYGIHSWYKNGYSRGKVYKFFNFNNSMFYEDMPNLSIDLTGYSSDWSTYEYLYDILRNKEREEKNFTFLVTVQNHLPFTNIDEEGTQFVEDDNELNSYLQYELRSDTALNALINFLKEYDEDTILLFFGDHQPNLNLEEIYGSNGIYSEEESSYIVPFFVWANYDIEEQKEIETSTNYLQNILFTAANMPKDPYTKYIEELRTYIPVITTQYYIDKDGNRYNIDDETSPYYEKLQEYWQVVYYQIFENK